MEWVESTGKSIDEAKNAALDHLGVHEDDAEFEVVADVTTNFFGRVKEEARVRARVRPTTPRNKDERRQRQRGGKRSGAASGGRGKGNRGKSNQGGQRQDSQNQDQTDQDRGERDQSRQAKGDGGRKQSSGDRAPRAKKSNDQRKEKAVNSEQPTMSLEEQADLAQEFLSGLAGEFGSTVEFSRAQVDEDIHLTLTGDDLGRMIGRRGNTAQAIDELVRTVLQRHAGPSRDGRIRVDIGGVRARRTEALGKFSREVAATVREA